MRPRAGQGEGDVAGGGQAKPVAVVRAEMVRGCERPRSRAWTSPGIEADAILSQRARHVVGNRIGIRLSMAWTDLGADRQTAI